MLLTSHWHFLALLVIGGLSNLACSQQCHEKQKKNSTVAGWESSGPGFPGSSIQRPCHLLAKEPSSALQATQDPLEPLTAPSPCTRQACLQAASPPGAAAHSDLLEKHPRSPFLTVVTCLMLQLAYLKSRLGLSTACCQRKIFPSALKIYPCCIWAPSPHKLLLSFH